MAKPDYEKDKEKYGESDLRIRSAGRDPKKLSEAAKQHPDYKGKLEWQGVSYDNVEDYQKAIDDSGASGRANYAIGPPEVAAGAVLGPIIGGKAVAAYGWDKTLEVGLSALFPEVEDTVLEQGMRMIPRGQTLANVSKASKGLFNVIQDVWGSKRVFGPEFAGDARVLGNWGYDDIADVTNSRPLQMSGTGPGGGGGWGSMSRFNPDHVDKVNYTLRQWDMPDGILDYNKFLSKVRKVDGIAEKTATEGREFVELFENISEFAEDFKGVRSARHAEFKARWVDFLRARDIDPSAVQLHHINALYDSLPLYDGLKFDSEEWWDLTAELLRNNVRPGTFASSTKKSNLMSVLGFSNQTGTGATDAMPHGVAHLFYKDKLGNPKYYGTNDPRAGFYSLDEINKMKTIPGYRLEKAQAYSEIVNRSEDIVEQAMKTWEVMNPRGNMSLEETIEFLGKLDDNGLLDVSKIEGRYQVPQLKQMIETITQEMDSLPRQMFENDQAFELWLLDILVDKNVSNKIFNPIKRKIKKRYNK